MTPVSPDSAKDSPAYNMASPAYNMASPTYNMASPEYMASPAYNMASPVYMASPGYMASPVSPACMASPAYEPISPASTPTPFFAVHSPASVIEDPCAAPSQALFPYAASPYASPVNTLEPLLPMTTNDALLTECKVSSKLILRFESIEESLFNKMQNQFAECPVETEQVLTRAQVLALVDTNETLIWPTDRLFKQRKWVLYRKISKLHYSDEDNLNYSFTASMSDVNENVKKIFFEDDLLHVVKKKTTSYNVNALVIKSAIHKSFQECTETSVRWNRFQTHNCVDILEKIIHTNGRYDYNYSIVWDMQNADVDIEVTRFEHLLRNGLHNVVMTMLQDVHFRQIWCDSMLTLKTTRLFKIHSPTAECWHLGGGETKACSVGIPRFMAHKLDGERCFGFLSSNGLLIVTSTTIKTIADPGLSKLKQVYYVVIEKINDDFILVDVVYLLRFAANLNPNFTSNNKMFETTLRPINISITDSVKFINSLPTSTIKKNVFIEVDRQTDQHQSACALLPSPDPKLKYDGTLAIMDNSIYKIKANHTIELEICLRSLLLQKLNEPKQQPRHKFLKQWKKQKIIVGQELFESFSPSDLRDVFGHVYTKNKEKYTLTPILWGDYTHKPQQFIEDHFSTHIHKRKFENRPPHKQTTTTNTTNNNTPATSSIHTFEILNTRAIVEFTCMVEPPNAPDGEPRVYLQYLRKRYDKLHADSKFKVKSIINSLTRATE